MSEALPPSLGGIVIEWVETYLVHGPGDVQGQPIELDDELSAFVWKAYELRPDGQRSYRRAFLSRPKGRAKSEIAAMLSCAELLGPVRFDGFDANGQPVGRPVTAPEILNIATEEDQAGFVYLAAKYMLENGEAGNAYPLDIGLTRTYLASGGSMEPITAKASSKDGGKSTFITADETHLWHTPELKRLHSTVRRNIVKRRIADGWMLETSTAHVPGEGSVAESSYDHARLVESGEVTDSTLLVDMRSAPADLDLSEPDTLRKAIVEVYGAAAPWTNVEGIMEEFSDPETDEAENRRYWLNQVVASTDQWLSLEVVKARADKSVSVAALEKITLGFDGARWDDSTALVGCRLTDGHLFTLGVWEKPDGPEGLGWEVPESAVDAAVHSAFNTYTVVLFYPDPAWWQEQVSGWHAEYGDVVRQWWTHRETPMARALERLHTSMVGGGVTHDGDARLIRHLVNARKRKTRAGDVIQKDKPKSRRKIDAAMAATLAYEARADAIADGALETRSRAAHFL